MEHLYSNMLDTCMIFGPYSLKVRGQGPPSSYAYADLPVYSVDRHKYILAIVLGILPLYVCMYVCTVSCIAHCAMNIHKCWVFYHMKLSQNRE